MAEVIERGSIYFVYCPIDDLERAIDMGQVKGFYIIMAPEPVGPQQKTPFRRLTVGEKRLPNIAPAQTSMAEEHWALVERIEKTPCAAAVPVGVGRYALVMHEGQSELAYVLEAPASPGTVQRSFGILPQASYAIKLKDPKIINPAYPSIEKEPQYPEALEILFDKDWISVGDERLLNYEHAQIILLGLRKDNVEQELGVFFEKQDCDSALARLNQAFKLANESCLLLSEIDTNWVASRAS